MSGTPRTMSRTAGTMSGTTRAMSGTTRAMSGTAWATAGAAGARSRADSSRDAVRPGLAAAGQARRLAVRADTGTSRRHRARASAARGAHRP
jgi:hypothetical protein